MLRLSRIPPPVLLVGCAVAGGAFGQAEGALGPGLLKGAALGAVLAVLSWFLRGRVRATED